MYDFGLTLRNLRRSRKMTQQKLADKLELSEAMISKYESNIAYPQFETLRSMAVVLNVSLDELCGLESRGTTSLHGLSAEQAEAVNSLIEAFRATQSGGRKGLSPEQCTVIGQIVGEFLRK